MPAALPRKSRHWRRRLRHPGPPASPAEPGCDPARSRPLRAGRSEPAPGPGGRGGGGPGAALYRGAGRGQRQREAGASSSFCSSSPSSFGPGVGLPAAAGVWGRAVPCRSPCAMDWQVLTRELSLYLESQVRVGFLGSGVGLSLVLGFGVAYACYYLNSIAKKPQLVASNDRFCRFLEEYCPVVTETYYPTIWCWEGRVQTLLRPFITSRPQVQYRNELIKTADGGQISLDWFDNNDSSYYPDASTRPTVLLLPGLTGTSKESYILHMIHQSETLGYRCVVFNNRGIAGEELLTPRTYCAANTEDLEAVIHYVHSLHPSAPFMAAGVSMGGMLLLNYLGKAGRDTPLMAAAIFSAGWNVFESVESLEKPLNWLLFNYYLTTCLQSSISRHRQMLEKLFDMDLVMKARTVREFDKQFTSVMFGYRSIDDYYEDASPCRKLKSVGIPVLCLNSVDDVFSPAHGSPVLQQFMPKDSCLYSPRLPRRVNFCEEIYMQPSD
ncbi:phospholipase ABHD3 isoform X4 [Aphelocoma coerulescens]|uniref:phospholipase ABHD3 isoform X4 n=1 Tax=Aphelocoma coerulescens TaxID=39617 RepID=UPI003604C43D